VRGIFATSIVHLKQALEPGELDSLVDSTFAEQPFVRRPRERLPEVVAVTGSNFAEVRITAAAVPAGVAHGQSVVCFSALDNLIKGGAGQAVQNMNLMLGLPETTALTDPGGYP